ncbi:hypothetical protein ZWY2020_056107 [Hordeum vulgare]|nr:hypothetical protein ZWY2020_056107 [Hordeum vulgare]
MRSWQTRRPARLHARRPARPRHLANGRAHACLAVLRLLRARHARYGKDRRVQRLAASARKDARAPAMAMPHMRAPEAPGRGPDYLDGIPDDLVLSIFSKLAASATSPSDLLSVYLTCKRLNGLGQQDMVFAKASPASLAAWSEPVQRFLKRCADAGNLEACYILGMIRFYCLGSRSGGATAAKAAAPPRLLAVIQFNGSGGAKSDRDMRASASLCPPASGFGSRTPEKGRQVLRD